MNGKGKIFLLDDDELIVSVLSRALKKEGYEIYKESKTEDVLDKIRSWAPDIVLLDITMPGRSGMDILKDVMSNQLNTQVVMLTADDSAETAVRAMKLGAVDYLTKPFDMDEVKIVLNHIMEKETLKQEVNYLRKAYSEVVERDFVGESDVIKQLLEKVQKLAQAHVSTILITGESGTGKEVMARYIHDLMFGTGTSWHAPFISINCAAMPESLLESELFGYEKGSFTDAKSDKKGLFELAKGGSILLDEIGDMKMDLQSKLLRVLEERAIRPIGAKREIPVDVVVIATSNRNLSEAVKEGEFRNDLFFRLTTFYLHIPPLRERKKDIPVLARYFLSHFSTKYNRRNIRGFSPEAEQVMTSYKWPGNVRELKNLIERFVVLESAEIIGRENMPKWIFGDALAPQLSSNGRFLLPDEGISLEEVEKDLIIQAMEKASGNKTLAAKLLDITYDTLRYQLKKFGIN